MVSDDTKDKTIKFLADNNNFGMEKGTFIFVLTTIRLNHNYETIKTTCNA